MTHRFPIKEIARQAGLGTATVDRVLNGRAHVSPQSRLRVAAAVEELQAQETQLAARGRRLFFDFVVEAPARFSREIRAAVDAVVPGIGGAVCRPRFLMQEIMEEQAVVAALRRIAKRGSHGVCLKARDTGAIRACVAALAEAGIPVVTFATDITTKARLDYVGLDNAGAGRTAAGLIAHILRDRPGDVLATRSHERFSGEEAREIAFRAKLADYAPHLRVVSVQGGSGVGGPTSRALDQVIGTFGSLRAVYSMGGGNRSILDTLSSHGLRPEVYVAHDLDAENRALIHAGQLDFILHHDLMQDMRNVFHAFLAFHRLQGDRAEVRVSTVQIVTPDNVPAGRAPRAHTPPHPVSGG